MENVIAAARSLGRMIQQDERYARYAQAQSQNENDLELQEMIRSFHRVRAELNQENVKADQDADRLESLDRELKELYADIFRNDNMIELNEARGALEEMVSFATQIITGASNGQNPDAIEYSASCGGSCASCAGCA